MKKYFLLSLALIISSLSFAQQIELKNCDKSIKLNAEFEMVEFADGDRFRYSPVNIGESKGSPDRYYLIDQCSDESQSQKTNYHKVKRNAHHFTDIPDSLIFRPVWVGEFNGRMSTITRRAWNSAIVWEIHRDTAYTYPAIELGRLNLSKKTPRYIYFDEEVLVSADKSKLVLICDVMKQIQFTTLIDQDLDVYRHNEIPAKLEINQNDTVTVNDNSKNRALWQVLTNDGLIFYTEGSDSPNGLPDQKVRCLDVPNKEKYLVTPSNYPGTIGWIEYFQYNGHTYAIAPHVYEKKRKGGNGFAIWSIDDFEGNYKDPALSYIPDSLFTKIDHQFNILYGKTSFLFFDFKENGFAILFTDIGSLGPVGFIGNGTASLSKSTAHYIIFNPLLNIVQTAILKVATANNWHEMNTGSILIKKELTIAQAGSAAILIYNAASVYEGEYPELNSNQETPRCTIISADGKVITYELRSENKPAGELVAANVVKQPAENTYKVYVVTQTSPHHYLPGYFILSP